MSNPIIPLLEGASSLPKFNPTKPYMLVAFNRVYNISPGELRVIGNSSTTEGVVEFVDAANKNLIRIPMGKIDMIVQELG